MNLILLLYFLIFIATAVKPMNIFANLDTVKKLTELVGNSADRRLAKNSQCKKDVLFWLNSIRRFFNALAMSCPDADTNCTSSKRQLVDRYFFAAKQVDSCGGIPSNVLGLNTLWMGSWEECLETKSDVRPEYATQFCYVRLGSSLSVSSEFLKEYQVAANICKSSFLPQWSICVPKSCSKEDITTVVRDIFGQKSNTLKICGTTCRPSETPKPDANFWIVCSIMLFITFLGVISTVFDYATHSAKYEDSRKSAAARCLLAFSVFTNGAEILEMTEKPGRIQCLDCIRSTAIIWVMMGDVVAIYLDGDNPITALEGAGHLLNNIYTSAYMAAETFFFLSGLLVAYVFFRTVAKNPQKIRSPVTWILYYVHRFVRLSPPYFILIAFVAVIYNFLTVGPLSFERIISSEPCKTDWWRNVLYANKIYGNKGDCLPHSWYLAADMQMYILAPFVLVPLYFCSAAGFSLAAMLLVTTMAINYGVYIKYNLPASYIGYFAHIYDKNKRADFNRLVYYAIWLRFTPYLIGILTGYFLSSYQSKRLRLNWITATLVWIIAAAIGFVCVFGVRNNYWKPSQRLSTFARASFSYWSRIGWALALAWMVIACEKNWAGAIKKFMELQFWHPLGRLTYCAYLTHSLLISLIFSMERHPIHFVNPYFTFIREGIPVFIVTFVTSFVWSCLFEIPFGKLELIAVKTIFGDHRSLTAGRSANEVINGYNVFSSLKYGQTNCKSKEIIVTKF